MHRMLHSLGMNHFIQKCDAHSEAASLGKEGKPGGHATRKRSLFAPTAHTLPYISYICCCSVDTCGFCAGSERRGTRPRKSKFTHVSWDPISDTHVPWEPLVSYFTFIGCQISFLFCIALWKKCDAADDDDGDKCATPLITENSNPSPPFPRPTATCVSVPPLPSPRVTSGALGHQVPGSRVSTPTPCRGPRVIKLTAPRSAKLHRRAPSPGGDPLGKLFLHCEHFAEGRLPSGSPSQLQPPHHLCEGLLGAVLGRPQFVQAL